MKYFHSPKQRKSGPLVLKSIGTLLAFGLVIYLIWQNWNEFVTNLQRLHYSYILAVLGLAFSSRFFKTLRWFYLIKAIKKDLSFGFVFKLSFVGLFTSNILPSTIGGDVIKLAGAIRAGLEPTLITASLILDRLIGMVTMATFLPPGLMLLLQYQTLEKELVFAGGGFIGRACVKLKSFFQKTWSAIKLWSKSPISLVIATILSYLFSLSTFSIVYLILMGLGEDISWWTAGGLWVVIYFITLIPISINGLGLQEASFSFFYVTYAGVSEANSLILAVLIRLVFTIASLPGALFLPWVMSGIQESNKQLSTAPLNKKLDE